MVSGAVEAGRSPLLTGTGGWFQCCTPAEIAAFDPDELRQRLEAFLEYARSELRRVGHPEARPPAPPERVAYPTDPKVIAHSVPVAWGSPRRAAVVRLPTNCNREPIDRRGIARQGRARASRAPPSGDGDSSDSDPDPNVPNDGANNHSRFFCAWRPAMSGPGIVASNDRVRERSPRAARAPARQHHQLGRSPERRSPAAAGGSSMTDTPLAAAFRYAGHLGWPVFPVGLLRQPNGKIEKRPLTPHGLKDASRDPAVIEGWWGRYSGAAVGMPTGSASGVVILDVDCKDPAAYGPDTLDDLGMSVLPNVPISHTISGGWHNLFATNPEIDIRNSEGRSGLGPGLDVRGSGGFIVLPSGTVMIRNLGWHRGYFWDPHCNLDTMPLRPAPAWLGHRTKKANSAAKQRRSLGERFDPQKALDEACANIRNAGPGEKYHTIRREPFIVACLVRDRLLDEKTARHAVDAALKGLERHAADHEHMWAMADGAWSEGLAAPQRRASR
jgi:hypothetical protein